MEAPPDLVVLTDVLEHLIDPDAMLDRIASRMGPGGLICIAVPNACSFDDAPSPPTR